MKEVSLTDTEDEADDDEPETTPHDVIGKATICKYYGYFKKAIGNKIWFYFRFNCFSFIPFPLRFELFSFPNMFYYLKKTLKYALSKKS